MRRLLPSLTALGLLLGCAGADTAPRGPRATGAKPSPAGALPSGAPASGLPVSPGPVASGQPQPEASASTVALASNAPLPAPVGALVGQVFAPPAMLSAAGILSNNGSGLVANNSGSLVVDQGSGLIGNNGSGLVANNSGSYRLLALDRQVAAVGALVVLVDAAGQPILGADGKAMETRTDAQGRYAFATAPSQHAIARVSLGSQGQLEALVVPGVKQAALDLSSSLVSSYVLSQYVASQAKPKEVLARLPAEVEAETRQKAVLALAAGNAPSSLTSVAVTAAVEALRKANAGFDAQMETVKRLLLAAGVADLGAGRPATEVFMGRIDRVLPGGPGGALAMYTPNDHRVWGLTGDGTLVTLAGSGIKRSASSPAFEAAAKQADVDYLWGLAWDSQKRLWALENEVGLWRVEGGQRKLLLSWATMKTAMASDPFGAFALAADDSFWQVSNGQLFSWKEGESAPRSVGAVAGVSRAMDFAALPDGSFLHRRFDEFKRIAAGSLAVSVAFDPVASGARATMAGNRNDFAMDGRGHILFVGDADGRVHALKPGGGEVVGALRSGLKAGLFTSAVDESGAIFAVDVDSNESEAPSVLRRALASGAWETVAGRDRYLDDFAPNGEFSLQGPSGLDVEADGTLWVADYGALLKVKPAGAGSEVVLPSGTLVGGLPMQITGVRLLGGGRLALRASGSNQERFAERAADGSLNVLATAPKGAVNLRHTAFHAWDAHPTGGWAWAQFNQASFPDTTVALFRRPVGASQNEEVVPISGGISQAYKLRVQADGAIWVLGSNAQGQLKRWVWREVGGLQEAPANAAFPDALDAQGRAYEGGAPTYTLGDVTPRRIWRQALSGAPLLVAGPGTALLPGPSLDEGIGSAADLRFDAEGALYYRDPQRRIVRRIPGDRLPP